MPHNLLIKKLNHYGIRGNLSNWFSSYLSNRSQQTIIENETSEALPNSLGVPQGSVLGPLLFLIFINDLPNISKLLFIILFADDATLTLIGKDITQLIENANSELTKFHTWCLANRLSINVSKTFYMIFSKYKITVPLPLLIKSGYTYDVINKVKTTKFLGVHLDDNMTFKTHLNHLSQKLSRINSLFYQVRDLIPLFVLKRMYFAHVQSLLSYCNVIWSNTNSTDLNSVTIAQKRIIRTITKSDILAHTRPLFMATKILTIEQLRRYFLGIYCFKNQTNFHHLMGQHNYRTRRRHDLRPVIHRTSFFEKSFLYQAPIIWNEINTINPELRRSASLNKFKRSYKLRLLSTLQ